MRTRRRSRGFAGQPKVWDSELLRSWVSDNTSSVILLQGVGRRSEESRDVALDTIDLLKSENVPVVWHLAPSTATTTTTATTNTAPPPLKMTDLLRSWIRQLIEQYPEKFNDSSLNESKFSDCTCFNDWLRLFMAVLGHLPLVSLVIDGQGNTFGILDTVSQFWNVLTEQKCRTVVKIMILTYEDAGEGVPAVPSAPTVTYSTLKVASPTAQRSSRILLRAGRNRRAGMSRGTFNTGPDSLRPLVRQLTTTSEAETKAPP
jgi:hypothetical protein